MSQSQIVFNALIPARAGSKSIVNKNLQRLGGRPLVQWPIELAKSWKFHKIIISTDITSLLMESFSDGRILLHRRSDKLSDDEATMESVVSEVISHYKINESEWIVLLQPTSPFRSIKDLDIIYRLVTDNYCKSVISVTDVCGNHPDRMYTTKGSTLRPLRHTSFSNRQSLKKIYIRNGCFYAFNVGEFLRLRSFYLHPCLSYLMDKELSINIDNEMDLMMAKQMVTR